MLNGAYTNTQSGLGSLADKTAKKQKQIAYEQALGVVTKRGKKSKMSIPSSALAVACSVIEKTKQTFAAGWEFLRRTLAPMSRISKDQ